MVASNLDTGYFRHHREKIEYAWEGGSPHVGTLFRQRLKSFSDQHVGRTSRWSRKHRDLARSVQAMYEEAFFHLLNSLHERHKLDSLAIAAGVP